MNRSILCCCWLSLIDGSSALKSPESSGNVRVRCSAINQSSMTQYNNKDNSHCLLNVLIVDDDWLGPEIKAAAGCLRLFDSN